MEQMNTTNRISLEDRTLRLLKLLKSEDLHNRRIDEASHFILRLSFCQTEELRRRFLENECGLLKFRLSELPAPELANAVQEYMHIAPVDASVLSTVESKLRALRPHNGGRAEAEEKFYVVPFTQALDLIARRECYLQAGRAYVPQSKVVAIVSRQFRAQLSRQLKLLAQHQNQWMDEREEKRLQPLLRSMHHWSHAKPTDYSDTGDAVALTADGMDEAVAHMPLCMRLLDQGMRQDKTLKHQGRVQYGFFLRTANMPEDELLRYFQKHFQQVTAEKFQKQYAPSFKHMYKDRGNTGGYTGYGCMKIINFHSPAKVGEHHGCPFKYNDEKNLYDSCNEWRSDPPRIGKKLWISPRHGMILIWPASSIFTLLIPRPRHGIHPWII